MNTNPMQFGEQELAFIQEATAFAASTTDLSDLLQGILARGQKAVHALRGFVAKVDFDSGQLITQCVVGPDWTEEKRRRRLHWHTGDGKGITTYVAATGEPYWTGDVNNDPYYLPSFDNVTSEIAVPIVDAQNRTRGVINLDSPESDLFDEKDAALLKVLANVASLGMSVEEHTQRERAFVEIGTKLSASLDTRSLASKVIKVAAEVLRFEDCSLFLLDKEKQMLTLEASRGRLNEATGSASYRLGEGLTGWIAEHGQPIRTADPNSDPRWLGLYREFSPDESGAYLGVPIESQDGVIGVLRVIRRKSKFQWFRNEFTEDDEGVLTSIATQVGAVVQNLRLMNRVINAERMAAWGEMSARSAHMMGNRMFAIKGDLNELNYQLSQSKCTERRELEELAKGIGKGVYHLEEMLQEFRDFMMATQLNLTETDVNDVIRESVEEFVPKRSNIRLEVSLNTGLSAIQADQSKLKRCFAELIENAISYQIDGGLLRVATSTAPAKEARTLCGLPAKRRYIRVEFADAGPGIPKEDKTKIFTPFFTSRAKGMGLGLSIVKGIVEAHLGRICEVGNEGTGARFVIFLPVSEQR